MQAIYLIFDRRLMMAPADATILILDKRIYDVPVKHLLTDGIFGFKTEEEAQDYCEKKYGPDYGDFVHIAPLSIWQGSIEATFKPSGT